MIKPWNGLIGRAVMNLTWRFFRDGRDNHLPGRDNQLTLNSFEVLELAIFLLRIFFSTLSAQIYSERQKYYLIIHYSNGHAQLFPSKNAYKSLSMARPPFVASLILFLGKAL